MESLSIADFVANVNNCKEQLFEIEFHLGYDNYQSQYTQTDSKTVDASTETYQFGLFDKSGLGTPLSTEVGLTSQLLSATLDVERLKLKVSSLEDRLVSQTSILREVASSSCARMKELVSEFRSEAVGRSVSQLWFARLESEADQIETEILDAILRDRPRQSDKLSLVEEIRAFRHRLFGSVYTSARE